MRVNDFIGMKVIDVEAKDVGKIEDLAITIKECLIEQIFISTGSTLSKKFFSIKELDIMAIGDYVQLKFNGEAIENKPKVDKLDDLAPKEKRFKAMEGKIVLTKEGVEIGKIQDMVIDPAECRMHNVIISMGGTFNRKQALISSDDIAEIGDYMILKLSKEQIEELSVD